jgi:hypothetical protein
LKVVGSSEGIASGTIIELSGRGLPGWLNKGTLGLVGTGTGTGWKRFSSGDWFNVGPLGKSSKGRELGLFIEPLKFGTGGGWETLCWSRFWFMVP